MKLCAVRRAHYTGRERLRRHPIFTKQGQGTRQFAERRRRFLRHFRETLESEGKIDGFDYSIGASRTTPTTARPNNQYRNSAAIAMSAGRPMINFESAACSRIRLVIPQSEYHFRSETNRQFFDGTLACCAACRFRLSDWWEHKLIASYDHERQLNDPNQDGFVDLPVRCLRGQRSITKTI